MPKEAIVLTILNLIINKLGIYLALIIIGLKIISLLREKNELIKKQYDDSVNNLSTRSIQTKEFHEFLKLIITEATIIKFQKFKMNNDMSKSNRTSLQHLISEVATETFESLQKSDSLFDKCNLLTKEYYMKYITDITIVTVDKLINSTIDDVI